MRIEPHIEEAIVRGARSRGAKERGDALATLFRTLQRPVFSLCVHLTGNRSDAEDALQETFLAVSQALPRFRGESALGTFVYRVALRTAFRVKARHAERPLPPPDAGVPATDELAAAREEARRVAQALAQLPAEQRAVLSLFAVEGLSHGEIADVLGVAEGTIWSRLSRARTQLGALLR